MALTLADYKLHAQHAAQIDATLPPSATATSAAAAQQIVNQAGRYLFKHPWNFRIAGPAILSFTAPIDIASGTWTDATKTLTKTAGFASYTFAKSDIIEITDGTGATEGLYHIASRTSDDAIVLSTSIGSAADGQTDIDGTIKFPYVALPSDFGNLISLEMNSRSACISLTTVEQVLMRRMRNVAVNDNDYFGAIVQTGRLTATTALGVARIELDHAPTSVDSDAMFCTYRRAWLTLTDDTHYPEIPEWVEDLLIEYVRAFAEGYMNRHADTNGLLPVVTTDDRLDAIRRLEKEAREYDGLWQSDYGSTGDGPAGYPYHTSSWRSRTSGAVADPS